MNSITAAINVGSVQQADTPTQSITTGQAQLGYVEKSETKFQRIKIVAYGEAAASLLQCNGPTLVSGRLQIEKYEAPEGHKENKLVLVVSQIISGLPEMKAFTCVNLIGRTGGDPDVNYFESGKVVCKPTLAVQRNKEDKDWFNLEAWGKTAETIANYVGKGSQIGVSGSIKFDTWQDRNTGADRSKPIIRVDRVELLQTKPIGGSNGSNDYATATYDDVAF